MKNANIKELGFTLIELLVVVLIVGILAAVAVPQYQKAVSKSSLMCIMPILKSLSDAQAAVALEQGGYPSNGYFKFEDLAVDVKVENDSCKSTDECNVICGRKSYKIILRNTQTWANTTWVRWGRFSYRPLSNKTYMLECMEDDTVCISLAKSFGAANTGSHTYAGNSIKEYTW